MQFHHQRENVRLKRLDELFVEFDPSAGDPTAHVLYSQADVVFPGVVVDEPVPDSFSAGAERTTCQQYGSNVSSIFG